ncbi:MAG: hypothetical protein BWZ07_02648 [Alphaproteobacteria bacterium ADurb.BinA280]|nr:MAG: hypothetical protein BWZ07_02648 [Alphaproteobacteria bacterium ADurb.BinA280]
MQCTRHQLFARARFALNQHRGIRTRQPFDLPIQALHGGRAPNEINQLFALIQRLIESPIFLTQCPAAQSLLHHEQQRLTFKRFGEVIVRTSLHSLDGVLDTSVRGDQYKTKLRATRAYLAQQGQTIAVAKLKIGDHELQVWLGQKKARILQSGSTMHHIAMLNKQVTNQQSLRWVIFDQKQVNRRVIGTHTVTLLFSPAATLENIRTVASVPPLPSSGDAIRKSPR